jgi:hypothetical protein
MGGNQLGFTDEEQSTAKKRTNLNIHERNTETIDPHSLRVVGLTNPPTLIGTGVAKGVTSLGQQVTTGLFEKGLLTFLRSELFFCLGKLSCQQLSLDANLFQLLLRALKVALELVPLSLNSLQLDVGFPRFCGQLLKQLSS